MNETITDAIGLWSEGGYPLFLLSVEYDIYDTAIKAVVQYAGEKPMKRKIYHTSTDYVPYIEVYGKRYRFDECIRKGVW